MMLNLFTLKNKETIKNEKEERTIDNLQKSGKVVEIDM